MSQIKPDLLRVRLVDAVVLDAFDQVTQTTDDVWRVLLPWDQEGSLKVIANRICPGSYSLDSLRYAVGSLASAVNRWAERRQAMATGITNLVDGYHGIAFDLLDEVGMDPSLFLETVRTEFRHWEAVFRERYATLNAMFERLRNHLAEGNIAATGRLFEVESRWSNQAPPSKPVHIAEVPSAFWDDVSLMLTPCNHVMPLQAFDGDPFAGAFSSIFGEMFDSKQAWLKVEDAMVSNAKVTALRLGVGSGGARPAMSPLKAKVPPRLRSATPADHAELRNWAKDMKDRDGKPPRDNDVKAWARARGIGRDQARVMRQVLPAELRLKRGERRT